MFEWDPEKNENNKILRGFGFELAHHFDFAAAQIYQDSRKEYNELRYRAFGRIDGVSYMIAFTIRNDNIRIISMRRMHGKEAKRYGI